MRNNLKMLKMTQMVILCHLGTNHHKKMETVTMIWLRIYNDKMHAKNEQGKIAKEFKKKMKLILFIKLECLNK